MTSGPLPFIHLTNLPSSAKYHCTGHDVKARRHKNAVTGPSCVLKPYQLDDLQTAKGQFQTVCSAWPRPESSSRVLRGQTAFRSQDLLPSLWDLRQVPGPLWTSRFPNSNHLTLLRPFLYIRGDTIGKEFSPVPGKKWELFILSIIFTVTMIIITII